MSLFIVRAHFLLTQGSFNRGELYDCSVLKPTEKAVIGDTIKEVVTFLERGGYIQEVPEDIKELLKLLLRLK